MAFAMGGSLCKQTSSGGGWCIRSYGEVAITSSRYKYKLKFKKKEGARMVQIFMTAMDIYMNLVLSPSGIVLLILATLIINRKAKVEGVNWKATIKFLVIFATPLLPILTILFPLALLILNTTIQFFGYKRQDIHDIPIPFIMK